MKLLIKIIIFGFLFFSTILLLANLTGVLSTDQIENWLVEAQQVSPIYVASLVIALLFSDLYIPVPTLTISILSGFFLGFTNGVLASLIGVCSAGISGYWLSYYGGAKLLNKVVKDEEQKQDMIAAFNQYGIVLILISRAMPVLPEITACLAGLTKMPFRKFLMAWLLSSVPYVTIAGYFGAISTIDNPKPAMIAAVSISLFLWIVGASFVKFQQRKERKNEKIAL